MTKLLDEVIAKLRALPEEEQDAAAGAMLAFAERSRRFSPTPEQVADTEEGLAQARRGELASDAAVAAFWLRCGLSTQTPPSSALPGTQTAQSG